MGTPSINCPISHKGIHKRQPMIRSGGIVRQASNLECFQPFTSSQSITTSRTQSNQEEPILTPSTSQSNNQTINRSINQSVNQRFRKCVNPSIQSILLLASSKHAEQFSNPDSNLPFINHLLNPLALNKAFGICIFRIIMKMCWWVGEGYFQFLHLHQAPVLRMPTWIPKTKAVSRCMYHYSLCTKAMDSLGWKSLVVFERGSEPWGENM